MSPHEFRALARPQIKKLARRGKLVDTAFKVFCDACFPGASDSQRSSLRIAFFAGAAELHVLQMMAADESTDATDGDFELYGQVATEIESFHQGTIAAMRTPKKS
jgi:hypothetical protein